MKLDDIRRICEAATPGPWRAEVNGTPDGSFDFAAGPWHDQTKGSTDGAAEDAVFIAMARTMLPKLQKVAEAARDLKCACVGLTYHGGHTNSCIALREALAALESDE